MKKNLLGCLFLAFLVTLGSNAVAANHVVKPAIITVPSIATLNPKTTLTILGAGFKPGQQVLILFEDNLGVSTALPIMPVADERGNWATLWKLGDYVSEKKITEGIMAVTVSDVEYNLLASAPVGLVDNRKDPKQWPAWAAASGITPEKKAGPVKVNATVVKTEQDGRVVVFKTEKGETVSSRLSSSRSKIKKGGKALQRSDVKAGMKISVTYMADGDRNEPSEIMILE